jgi:DNA-binding NarL/FixJ family response regulator
MTTIKRIIIADDHAIFREGLKQVIAKTADTVVADEAANGQELLKKVRETDYDAVLLDISMPGRSGLDILGDLKALRPRLPVIILSMYPEEQYAVRAFRAGAAGYLTKGSPVHELFQALEKVALGRKYVSPALAEALVASMEEGHGEEPHTALSNREYQVLCMIASGKTVGRIAAELTLSVKTVSTYRTQILKKMCMRNNAELTRYAIQHQLA